LRVFDTLPEGARGMTRLGKGVGVVLFVCGSLQFVGVALGSHNVMQPLDALVSRGAAGSRGNGAPLAFESIASVSALEERLKRPGKPVMLDFYADWCVSCKEMERFTYSDPRVAAGLSKFDVLKADVTASNDNDQALLKRFHLYGPPAIIFFDGEGHEVRSVRVIGYENAESFLTKLAKFGT
jgi:thiol:disulfide interchange protein DsbD